MSETTTKVLAFAILAMIALLAGKDLTMNLGDDTLKIG